MDKYASDKNLSTIYPALENVSIIYLFEPFVHHLSTFAFFKPFVHHLSTIAVFEQLSTALWHLSTIYQFLPFFQLWSIGLLGKCSFIHYLSIFNCIEMVN